MMFFRIFRWNFVGSFKGFVVYFLKLFRVILKRVVRGEVDREEIFVRILDLVYCLLDG